MTSVIPVTTPTSRAIPLAPLFLRTHGRQATEEAIRKVVCSVAFDLSEAENAIRLLGPEMSYHCADPYLPETLGTFCAGMGVADVASFRSSQSEFDLCFEDSWTGSFIARRMAEHRAAKEFVLIHLDDHTDMMSTLLSVSGQQLIDPTSGAVFDPGSRSSWQAAIGSGAVNIGNYITPFFYSGCKVHVRHVRDAIAESEPMCVVRRSREYELIPETQFAAIEMRGLPCDEGAGTYWSGSNPETLLRTMPNAWTIIHIDLDYFINDFNGASRGASYVPGPELRTIALEKMDRFFAAVQKRCPAIDRWIIATSPGFCCSCHWEFLLSELRRRIVEVRTAQPAG